MGRAFAERFVRAGMKVVLADVTDGAAVDRLRDAAIERFGRVHVLCNNAGDGGTGPSGGQFVTEGRTNSPGQGAPRPEPDHVLPPPPKPGPRSDF